MSDHRDSFAELLARRMSRRRLMQAGAAAALASAFAVPGGRAVAKTQPLAFGRVAPSREDRVIVPEGYRADVVLRWGDPLFDDAAALDARRVAQGALLEPGAAAEQLGQFGYNCDGVAAFDIGPGRALLCINHEFPSPDLLFPGWSDARRTRSLGEFVRQHPQCVEYMQAAVGVSVVELRRDEGAWRYRRGAPLNRRITAATPIELTGPARAHPLLSRGDGPPAGVNGTLGNCAAGPTPWGTYLTAEENIDDYFGRAAGADFEPALARAYRRFGPRLRDSAYRWEYADVRFDATRTPAEALKFGWIVEIDPKDPSRPIKKRTALGRFKHESATTVLSADRRCVVYMGDDEAFEYLYKFVSRRPFEPRREADNADLLDDGRLYVARFAEDGHGEWVELVWGERGALSPATGFDSQADVLLRCREAADRLGATPLDRPEDIAVNSANQRVYVSLTQNLERGLGTDRPRRPGLDTRADAVNPRAPNPSGHIIELAEQDDDASAVRFRWDVLLLAGAPAGDLLHVLPLTGALPLEADATYFAGHTNVADVSAFANPDNLEFDSRGRLWIVTDGKQPEQNNNGCFVCPTDGPGRGAVRQFMSGPVGAEICGCEMSEDERTLFLTVQHPGQGGTAEEPHSAWPDGTGRAPRPSLVAIEPEGAGRRLGD
jgi:secreted PhoX family phosphatase